MFKFNFNAPAEEQQVEDNASKCVTVIDWAPAQEVFKADVDEYDEHNTNESENILACGDLKIYYSTAQLEEIEAIENNELILEFEAKHSDLLQGKYEGGFKIWECTHDLVEYMSKNLPINFGNARVLDLGCGAGLLGIYCMLQGAVVHFQDYNLEVLKLMTIPNVERNLRKNCYTRHDQRFFCGDWASYTDLVENEIAKNDNEKFDYILSAETIYNIDNYEKLYVLIKKLLKKTGVLYLSAKSHYFGVGGGVKEFEAYVTKDKLLDSECIWECRQGVRRSILKITHISHSYRK